MNRINEISGTKIRIYGQTFAVHFDKAMDSQSVNGDKNNVSPCVEYPGIGVISARPFFRSSRNILKSFGQCPLLVHFLRILMSCFNVFTLHANVIVVLLVIFQ